MGHLVQDYHSINRPALIPLCVFMFFNPDSLDAFVQEILDKFI